MCVLSIFLIFILTQVERDDMRRIEREKRHFIASRPQDEETTTPKSDGQLHICDE